MKFRHLFAISTVLIMATLPLRAVATSTYNVPAANGALEVNVTSTTAWTAQSGQPFGARMAFQVPVSTAGTIDLEVTFVSPPPQLSSAGECTTSVPINPVLTETLTVTTLAKSSTAVTCRISYSGWPASMGRSFVLLVRDTANTMNNRHATVPIELFNVSNQLVQPVQQTPRAPVSAPKYAGPEFLSFGAPVLAGDRLVSQGKRLDGITSLKINGAAATFKVNSSSELEIDVPKDLAPGKYDIEITSTHGKLTHLQAFTVKAVVPTKTLEFKGDGRTLGYEELLELTKIAKQIGSEYTSVRCIVNASDASVAQRLVDRGCDYVGAIRLRGKEITTEAKSTYKGDGFWFKIVANG